jgi:hypothetical protein
MIRTRWLMRTFSGDLQESLLLFSESPLNELTLIFG